MKQRIGIRIWLAASVYSSAIILLGGCNYTDPDPISVVASDNRAQRIVSLDYCADQYVLKLADREQILAISPDAVKDFSYMQDAAVGVPTVRPVAEDVLILKPDLIVRTYGGGPNAAAFFKRAGVPVLQVGWAKQIRVRRHRGAFLCLWSIRMQSQRNLHQISNPV